jgi:histidinol dehydrogenase
MKIRRLQTKEEILAYLGSHQEDMQQYEQRVQEIAQAVKARGDEAILSSTVALTGQR